MTETTVTALPVRRRLPAGKLCPSCRQVLDGGPVVFWCAPCRRAVYAADLDDHACAPLRRTA